jgi:uncharacterized protein involved in tolerance to divalent cations
LKQIEQSNFIASDEKLAEFLDDQDDEAAIEVLTIADSSYHWRFDLDHQTEVKVKLK